MPIQPKGHLGGEFRQQLPARSAWRTLRVLRTAQKETLRQRESIREGGAQGIALSTEDAGPIGVFDVNPRQEAVILEFEKGSHWIVRRGDISSFSNPTGGLDSVVRGVYCGLNFRRETRGDGGKSVIGSPACSEPDIVGVGFVWAVR